MAREYTPWIDHDGQGFPVGLLQSKFDEGFMAERIFVGKGRTATPIEQAMPDLWDPDHPGWIWKRSGWFGRGDLVASDPTYARIVRYRFWRDVESASEQFEVLADIVALKRIPVQEDA